MEWHFHWAVWAVSPAQLNTICRGGGTVANWNSSPGSCLKTWQWLHIAAWLKLGRTGSIPELADLLSFEHRSKQTKQENIQPNSGDIFYSFSHKRQTFQIIGQIPIPITNLVQFHNAKLISGFYVCVGGLGVKLGHLEGRSDSERWLPQSVPWHTRIS